MRDLWKFLWAFWRTLISFITGGILAAFLTIWTFFGKHAPPPWIWWGSLAIYFFLSAFGVWKKEHQRANKSEADMQRAAAQQETPDQIFADMQDTQLKEKLAGFEFNEARELFWKTFREGRIPDKYYYRDDKLRPLMISGLIKQDEQTGHIFIAPEYIEPAKRIHARSNRGK
ncbi:MAG: hypothetical protein ABSD28_07385 [Tepidisphaeraceae bacterium]|jgi:signal transduction histidine kinase